MSAFGILPFPLLMAAGPVTIEDVTTEVRGDQLTVEVTTSGRIAPDDVNIKNGRRKFYLYVDGGRTEQEAFANPDRTVKVHPRARYTKLEIPWGPGLICEEDVAVETTGKKVRATVACTRGAAAPSPAKQEPESDAETTRLKAALALPPEPTAEIKAEAPKAPVVKEAEAATAAKVEPAAETKSAAKPEAKEAAPIAAALATPEKAPSAPELGAATASSSGAGVILPGFLLLGLAAGGYLMARKRVRRQGMIQIMETASLGPKRALVVAKIGNETIILGASEAGITLLRTVGAPDVAAPLVAAPTVAAAAVSAPAIEDDIKIEDAMDGAEQAGLLSRLFRRRHTDEANSPDVKPGDWRDFDDLLQESMEDQELRRRLSLGLGGKVS